MKTIETDILIIGAGPAGLACAMELANAGKNFVAIEKDPQVGGLSKTYVFREGRDVFRTDNGPHRFFSKNEYLYNFIENLIKEDWIKVNRQTRQYIDGKFYDYPVNFLQTLSNLGLIKASRMLVDYIISKIKFFILRKKINNFEDYVLANFGRSLGNFNMINYTEKIWGIPAADIHSDWAGQRIKGLSLISLTKNAFLKLWKVKQNKGPKSLVDVFFYPKYGTGLIYETIVNHLRDKGYTILTNAAPKKILHKDGRLYSAIIEAGGEQIDVRFNTLVESIPINKFLKVLDPLTDTEILKLSNNLSFRNQVYLFLTINKPYVTKDQWIYFPSKEIPFARISEMKNFSKEMSPKDKTSLFIEFFCFEHDDLWRMGDEDVYNIAMKELVSMGFVTASDISNYYVIRKEDVYPVYNLEYKVYLEKIKDYLNKFENLHYIGRPGRFQYTNQDHSLEMGLETARSIIDGSKRDLDMIGTEKEYLEKGSIPAKSKV